MITAIRRRLQRRDEGFTLIELLIVVIIIGILAAIAIPTFLNQRQGAFEAAVKSDLRNAAIAVEQRYTQGLGYTAPAGGFRTSDAVTLTLNAPPANSSSGKYCILGDHASLTVDWHYDEAVGRPTSGGCAAAPPPAV
ncbi:MAG: prepilin-type N-terminal cleavage/methylation domain-containing protein [Actinobacteria bacterium]|nr:prepilin-type N-terminal cleavage/methylation domain-containing protein [Actinomycetota bacterium]